MRSLPLLLALSLAPAGEAATVFRCEDASGHVTFTQLGCPNAQAGERIEADNPPPGGTSVTPMATPAPLRREAPSVVVVGEGKEKCGARLGEQERRKAIVEQRIVAGMTRADVERALGKPDQVSGNNAEMTYRYKADKRRGARSVSFDQEGCVKGKADSGSSRPKRRPSN
ncbi:hypothetical protein AXX04_23120 [Pseudomonas aeruginosa]|uniref:DUF4124 domain-containing protein n=1 Tax=Pseudomonas aeruginosa TaxID=287 RepID=UPI000E69E065|nr:DUF4124 domain-containing protein [Pseudomonas aeruginosa]RIZ35345.1 hypothetical protein AXX04_23120 [Pseudomonas aeruginosa]